jgi:glycosyltransferase involved in cell wall biosynthesis
MKRICMFVYNNCTTDARVLKEARVLAEAGMQVTVVAVLDQTTQPHERRDGFDIVRIDRNPPHYPLLRWARGLIRLGRLGRAGVTRAAEIPFREPAEAPTHGEQVWRSLRARLERSRLLLPLLVLPVALWALWGRRRPRSAPAALEPVALRDSTVFAAPYRGLMFLHKPLMFTDYYRRAYRLMRDEPVALRDSTVFAAPYRGLMFLHKPLMFTDYYRRAYRLMRDEPVAAYHAHDLNTLPVAAALARRNGARLVYDSHELYPDISTLSPLESRIWRTLERALIRRVDDVVTVSQSIADELVARHGVRAPLILLNCPSRPAEVQVEPGLLRHKIGRDGDAEPIVLYQGGFAPNRGLQALVRSAHHLDAALLVLMGWGRLETELRELVATEALGERVVITGPVPHAELLAYTADAAVGVIPYEPVGLNNTFSAPNKLFDYLAVGVPVVASHLPEIVRFVHGLEVGRTFASAEPRAIATAVNDVLGDPAGAARMRENALRAGRELCWEVESVKLLDLYVTKTG